MSMIHFSNAYGFQNRYASDADSAAITNSTAETAFDQLYTLPSENQSTMIEGLTIRLTAMGTFSTGLVNLGFRLRCRAGGLAGSVISDSGALTLIPSLSNAGWFLQTVATVTATGASGSIKAQTTGNLQSGAAISIPGTGSVALDTTVPNDIVFTGQWTTASASNILIMRSLFVEVLIPVP